MTRLPEGTLLAWYGDDFTGSAAVMEELAFAGVETALFLRVPGADERQRFAGAKAIGLAGTARAHGPAWMADHLPPAFAFLKSLDAALNLYKICSTLDSSADIGSIGAAIGLARATFGEGPVPIFPASPKMDRFQCFGTLFARAGDGIHRLDRHPVVARHPVTPMDEADVARHLARQTDEAIGTLMLPDLHRINEAWGDLVRLGNRLITIDTARDGDLLPCGRLFTSLPHGSLIAGSQGVAEALVAVWRADSALPPARPHAPVGPSHAMVALSGSLSPTTSQQIAEALNDGFAFVPLDAAACLGADRQGAIESAIQAALAALSAGRAPLIASATGPDDPAVATFKTTAQAAGLGTEAANMKVGQALGAVLGPLAARKAIDRVAVAGGDTSGYVLKQLDALALTGLAPLTPGAGLYRLHPANADEAPLEISLKGGQMGSPRYFSEVRAGKI